MILLAQDSISTRHGTFRESLFYNGLSQSVALTVGEIAGASRLLCRIHSSCLSAHGFGSISCDCSAQMDHAQAEVVRAGRGIIVWLEQEGRGNGHLAKMLAEPVKRRGLPQGAAYEAVGFQADARGYTDVVEILRHFKVVSVALLTNNPLKRAFLEKSGITVSDVFRVPRRAESKGVRCDFS
ncbi:GTP cyclohydrolase [Actinocrispum wychmicini]|uniref:GTP cyclohydrolase II n=1 Tax=Actinocrispum wychmicini TaxID=1213861 RepID=A0A4R2JF85_9PSEU|nr:GTP cyclohydrolase [Actinocrispum wychmicini]TCO52895.1 GTP cyclohydrolase II [Actinocrispum wychmicini]